MYSTHPFRPVIGNATFCADCPRGSSFGETHPWHAGHQPVALEQAVLGLERMPSEALWAELRGRPCRPMHLYTTPTTYVCSTHHQPVDGPDALCDGLAYYDGSRQAVAL